MKSGAAECLGSVTEVLGMKQIFESSHSYEAADAAKLKCISGYPEFQVHLHLNILHERFIRGHLCPQ